MLKMVTPIEELLEKEVNVLFSGFEEGCLKNILSNDELAQSLREKGYISNGENPDLTAEGMQITNKYWYERCEIILDEMHKNDDIDLVYKNIVTRIDISKHLFFTFIDNLVSIGKITQISRFISRQ